VTISTQVEHWRVPFPRGSSGGDGTFNRRTHPPRRSLWRQSRCPRSQVGDPTVRTSTRIQGRTFQVTSASRHGDRVLQEKAFGELNVVYNASGTTRNSINSRTTWCNPPPPSAAPPLLQRRRHAFGGRNCGPFRSERRSVEDVDPCGGFGNGKVLFGCLS
jgi:hypothetical protein